MRTRHGSNKKQDLRSLSRQMIFSAIGLATITSLAIIIMVICIRFASFKYYWALGLTLALLFIASVVLLLLWYLLKLKAVKDSGEITSGSFLGKASESAFLDGGVGLLTADSSDLIVWQSEYLTKIGITALDTPLPQPLLELKTAADPDKTVSFEWNGHTFDAKSIKEAGLYILRDITDYTKLSERFIQDSPLVMFARIDNYSDLAATMDDTVFTDAVSQIRSDMKEFASTHHLSLRLLRNGCFLFLGNKKEKAGIVENLKNFINNAGTGTQISTQIAGGHLEHMTISVGGADSYPDLASALEAAINMADKAVRRGGGQGFWLEYNSDKDIPLGASHEQGEKSINKASIKFQAKDFYEIIKSADNVLTLGHSNADYDSVGSCLAVKAICDTLNVPCKIVYSPENTEETCRVGFEYKFGAEIKNGLTADYNKATDLIKKNTLVVCTDVCDAARLVYPNFISPESDTKVAIIDHHRPGNNSFKRIVYSYISSTASSACEILALFIQYGPIPVTISKDVATIMLAGTMVDTSFFQNKTNSSTYSAMEYLRECNADPSEAASLIKESFSQFQTMMKILERIDNPTSDIGVASTPDDSIIVTRTVLAKAANQIMSLSGYRAAFTVGRLTPDLIAVSARSAPKGAGESRSEINVQKIMENIGGGGHFTAAAATFPNKKCSASTVKEVLAAINDQIVALRPSVGVSRDTKTGWGTRTTNTAVHITGTNSGSQSFRKHMTGDERNTQK